MKRRCDNCKTPLRGKKGHGFPVRGRLVCGQPYEKEKHPYAGCGLMAPRVHTPGQR